MADLTAIILTKNEEKNIRECIASIKGFAARVVVVDSGSDDDTCIISKELGADVYEHKFENYSKQFNWGIDNCNITTKWTLRIDADERFTPELNAVLENEMKIHENDNVNGFVIAAWLFFMGKKLKYGSNGRKKKLMVFKTGIGRVEDRKMDEHTVLSSGTSLFIKEKYLHYDFKDLDTYVRKLNWYATREMQDYFDNQFDGKEFDASNVSISRRRKNKNKYYRAPMFLRAKLYYLYCFWIKGNFLNGREGRMYSYLYHYYYRWLVDAKIYEQIKNPQPFKETGDLK